MSASASLSLNDTLVSVPRRRLVSHRFWRQWLGCLASVCLALGSNAAWAQYNPPPTNPTPPGGVAPRANNDMTATMVGLWAAIPVLNNDMWVFAPLDIDSVDIVDAPAHGSAHVDPATGYIWYFPQSGFIGTDTLTYTVFDMIGQESNVATVTIVVGDLPPAILDFHATPSSLGVWKFSGRVVDESPAGLTVTFGGLLTGRTATTAADGTFSIVLTLSPGQGGLVTAKTVDIHNQASNLAQDWVFNMPPMP